MKISSQGYRDQTTVDEKIAAADFTVTLSPVFEIDGEEYQVVLDGHHSHEAARQAGIEPTYITATKQMCDSISMLEDGNFDGFLEVHYMDTDWTNLETGKAAF